MFLDGGFGIMPFMKTRERNTLAKYTDTVQKKRKIPDIRDYIIPTGWKRKRNISGKVDEIVYADKKGDKLYILKPKPRPEPDIRDYIIPAKKGKKTLWSERVDEVLYGKK